MGLGSRSMHCNGYSQTESPKWRLLGLTHTSMRTILVLWLTMGRCTLPLLPCERASVVQESRGIVEGHPEIAISQPMLAKK